jgi:hypothetical protein
MYKCQSFAVGFFFFFFAPATCCQIPTELQLIAPHTDNCYHLWDISEANKDQTAVVGVPGLCKSIVNLPDNKRQTRFTFSKSPLVGKRRQIQCPKQPRYCAPAEAALNRQLGRSGKGILPLQCDEFPWASSEQGGAYLASDRRTATCVPAYQNNWHGQCIQSRRFSPQGRKQVQPGVLTVIRDHRADGVQLGQARA